VRYCLFNIFAATLHIEGRSSIRKLTTLHAMLTATHLSHGVGKYLKYFRAVNTPRVTSILETVSENGSTKVPVRVSELGFKQREK
jgi:hypothetical protein